MAARIVLFGATGYTGRLTAAAMVKRGFQHYHRDWWHFTFATPAPGPHLDFPIRARR